MKKWKPAVWAGLAMLIFALVFLVQSLTLDYSGPEGLGPGFFPLWLSGILVILSLLYIYETFQSEDSQTEPLPIGKSLRNILFILACLIIYVLVVPYIGFVLASALFLFVLLYREYKWYLNAGISLGTSLLLFWLFDTALSVSLPVNGLGW